MTKVINKAVRPGSAVYIQVQLTFATTILASNDGSDCFIGGEGDY